MMSAPSMDKPNKPQVQLQPFACAQMIVPLSQRSRANHLRSAANSLNSVDGKTVTEKTTKMNAVKHRKAASSSPRLPSLCFSAHRGDDLLNAKSYPQSQVCASGGFMSPQYGHFIWSLA